ncbi:MAG TPA: CAP domain-containing protein, partial [Pyrinomonadaceae bacterium]|nr:CAP domain-containing protein [Pyrinomonadaceae bacterium]
ASVSYAQKTTYGSYGNKEMQVLSLVNRERAHSGLSELAWNDSLADLAQNYSEKMAREGFFDHIDSDGNSVVERAKHSHIRGWQKIGENLFECDPTNDLASLAIRGWMHSPTHRDNILDPEWRATGIGIAYSSDGEIYITEVFADK